MNKTKIAERFNPNKYGMIFAQVVVGLAGFVMRLKGSMFARFVGGLD